MFGTLSKLLKLCGMKGVWGTRLPSGLFFDSIEVLEVIVLLSSRDVHHGSKNYHSQTEKKWERYLGNSVLALSLWFDKHLLAIAVHAIIVKSKQRL